MGMGMPAVVTWLHPMGLVQPDVAMSMHAGYVALGHGPRALRLQPQYCASPDGKKDVGNNAVSSSSDFQVMVMQHECLPAVHAPASTSTISPKGASTLAPWLDMAVLCS